MEQPTSPPPTINSATSSTGMETNAASLLAYLLWFVTGLIFLLIEKKDETVRWHAAQSIVLWVGLFIFFVGLSISSMIPFIGWMIALLIIPLASLGAFILWIVLMIKAYQGQKWELPVVDQFIPSVIKIGC